ncbi:10886_t:CDS:2 [Dentiscutata heterogama]|uniref:10886_t:CDS:1 n=1 Tax=Dentiscutata heterogama TaxID=1316150 RepID=A0ACA9LED3_9GLOM|nr:10886_t:CDS:2 [Dentiscutata heterogama]
MRPARKQAEESILKVGPSRISSTDTPGTFYNIWYNKWSGGERTSRFSREKAKTRCNVALDAGETKADKMPSTYFCLYFARGCCPFGHECGFWHRIPTESDPVDSTIDVFGRDKFNEYRDDMGGVGSFNRENRTLYVGYIHINPDMEEIVRKHFGEWVKILKDKGVAFVTYMSSLNAEFAKEAMSNQSLNHNEVRIKVDELPQISHIFVALSIPISGVLIFPTTSLSEWATDDPNPRAKAEYKRKAEALAAQAIQKSLPAEFTLGNTDYTNKRPRMVYNSIPDQYGLEGYQTPLGLEQPVNYDQSVGSGDGQHVETTESEPALDKY